MSMRVQRVGRLAAVCLLGWVVSFSAWAQEQGVEAQADPHREEASTPSSSI
jgi:hypothetical protein